MTAAHDFYCSEIAREYGLPLVGSATRADTWFLLEYTGRWGAQAFQESAIPAEVKARLQTLASDLPRLRIQLIRQPGGPRRPGLAFFVGQVSPLSPRLYQYTLQDYGDLLHLDLDGLAAGLPGNPASLRESPLYLVCLNSRRDRCCARYGPGVFRAVQEEAGDSAWASTHIGGHNQAPIALFFPHGVNYARATPDDARELVQATLRNQVVLHHYRGRVCLDPHLQAAEHFWRQQTGILDLPGLCIDNVAEMGPDQWAVTISDLHGGNRHTIRLQRRESDFTIPVSCAGDKLRPIITYQRLE